MGIEAPLKEPISMLGYLTYTTCIQQTRRPSNSLPQTAYNYEQTLNRHACIDPSPHSILSATGGLAYKATTFYTIVIKRLASICYDHKMGPILQQHTMLTPLPTNVFPPSLIHSIKPLGGSDCHVDTPLNLGL